MLRPTNAELRNSHCWIQTHSYSLQILTPTSPPLPPSECTRQAATRPLHEETIHWYKLLTGSDFNTVVEGRNYWKKKHDYTLLTWYSYTPHIVMMLTGNLLSNAQKSCNIANLNQHSHVWQRSSPTISLSWRVPEEKIPNLKCSIEADWKSLRFAPKSCSSVDCEGKQGESVVDVILWYVCSPLQSNFGIYTDQVQIFTF